MTAPDLTPATRASRAIDRARTSSSETTAQVALLESIAHSLVRIGDLLEARNAPTAKIIALEGHEPVVAYMTDGAFETLAEELTRAEVDR